MLSPMSHKYACVAVIIGGPAMKFLCWRDFVVNESAGMGIEGCYDPWNAKPINQLTERM